jgi:hypothetical protein
MEVKRGPALVLLGVVVVAVVLFAILSGGGSDSSSTRPTTGTQGKTPVIEIRDGQPVGGIQDLTFTEGGTIKFTVKSDHAWEIHFHGYDIPQDVKAGGETTFNVPATISGVFEVEIEDTATQIAQITVNPS